MKSTPGNWTYNPDFREVQWRDRTLATMVEGQEGAPEEELHANGYLMAASCELRDELTNLSRAVHAYIYEFAYDLKAGNLLDDVEVMLARAENALGHIFPPEGES